MRLGQNTVIHVNVALYLFPEPAIFVWLAVRSYNKPVGLLLLLVVWQS